MFVDIKNPKKTLEYAGYSMVGTSNQYKKHTNEREWFHAYIAHDEESMTLHLDISKEKILSKIYTNHKTFQKDGIFTGWDVGTKVSKERKRLEKISRAVKELDIATQET